MAAISVRHVATCGQAVQVRTAASMGLLRRSNGLGMSVQSHASSSDRVPWGWAHCIYCWFPVQLLHLELTAWVRQLQKEWNRVPDLQERADSHLSLLQPFTFSAFVLE